jgi:hypothetical protein
MAEVMVSKAEVKNYVEGRYGTSRPGVPLETYG